MLTGQKNGHELMPHRTRKKERVQKKVCLLVEQTKHPDILRHKVR
jgi:hypothetical protein